MKYKYYYGILQIIIGVIISIYVESVATGSLLFTDGILAETFRKKIVEHPMTVIGGLLFLNFIGYVLYQYYLSKEEMKGVYDNICRSIFLSEVKEDPEIDNNKTRVTLFKACKGYKFIGKYWSPKQTLYLKQVGRYQSTQDKKSCKIHFLPNEGCVGICYNLAQVVHQEISPYNEAKKELYYTTNQKSFNLSEQKIKKINMPSCSFLAFPINYFNSEDVFGVIIFDSTEKGKMKKLKARNLESKILQFSAFFNHKNIS
jgi:hypothetical protein